MPFAMALACFGMDLTFEEALVGATINAAYSLDRHTLVGSLEPGKQMDAVIVNGPAIDLDPRRRLDDPRGDQERESRGLTRRSRRITTDNTEDAGNKPEVSRLRPACPPCPPWSIAGSQRTLNVLVLISHAAHRTLPS